MRRTRFMSLFFLVLAAAFFLGVLWEKWFWLAWILLLVAIRTAQPELPIETQAISSENAGLRWHDLQIRPVPEPRLR